MGSIGGYPAPHGKARLRQDGWSGRGCGAAACPCLTTLLYSSTLSGSPWAWCSHPALHGHLHSMEELMALGTRYAYSCTEFCWCCLVPSPRRSGVWRAAGPQCPSPVSGALCKFWSGSWHHHTVSGSDHPGNIFPIQELSQGKLSCPSPGEGQRGTGCRTCLIGCLRNAGPSPLSCCGAARGL